MILPLWVMSAGGLLKRLWPLLAVAAVLLALWGWGNSRYDAGRTECEAAHAKAQQIWLEAYSKRRLAVEQAASQAAASVAETEVRYVDRIRTVVRDGPCLGADVVREIRAADQELAAAARNGAAPVRDTPDR